MKKFVLVKFCLHVGLVLAQDIATTDENNKSSNLVDATLHNDISASKPSEFQTHVSNGHNVIDERSVNEINENHSIVDTSRIDMTKGNVKIDTDQMNKKTIVSKHENPIDEFFRTNPKENIIRQAILDVVSGISAVGIVEERLSRIQNDNKVKMDINEKKRHDNGLNEFKLSNIESSELGPQEHEEVHNNPCPTSVLAMNDELINEIEHAASELKKDIILEYKNESTKIESLNDQMEENKSSSQNEGYVVVEVAPGSNEEQIVDIKKEYGSSEEYRNADSDVTINSTNSTQQIQHEIENYSEDVLRSEEAVSLLDNKPSNSTDPLSDVLLFENTNDSTQSEINNIREDVRDNSLTGEVISSKVVIEPKNQSATQLDAKQQFTRKEDTQHIADDDDVNQNVTIVVDAVPTATTESKIEPRAVQEGHKETVQDNSKPLKVEVDEIDGSLIEPSSTDTTTKVTPIEFLENVSSELKLNNQDAVYVDVETTNALTIDVTVDDKVQLHTNIVNDAIFQDTKNETSSPLFEPDADAMINSSIKDEIHEPSLPKTGITDTDNNAAFFQPNNRKQKVSLFPVENGSNDNPGSGTKSTQFEFDMSDSTYLYDRIQKPILSSYEMDVDTTSGTDGDNNDNAYFQEQIRKFHERLKLANFFDPVDADFGEDHPTNVLKSIPPTETTEFQAKSSSTKTDDDDDDRTLLDIFGEVAKEFLTKKMFKETDPNCDWNWRVLRCEPARYCSFQYLVGDYHFGRSCRRRPRRFRSTNVTRISNVQAVILPAQNQKRQKGNRTKTSFREISISDRIASLVKQTGEICVHKAKDTMHGIINIAETKYEAMKQNYLKMRDQTCQPLWTTATALNDEKQKHDDFQSAGFCFEASLVPLPTIKERILCGPIPEFPICEDDEYNEFWDSRN